MYEYPASRADALTASVNLSAMMIHHEDASTYTSPDRRATIREQVERGVMPALGNGYRFVTDTTHQTEYIPPREYTAYFSRREIPVAAKGDKLHNHDVGHMESYQDMFSADTFANLVQTAATNCLADEALCEAFTTSMDRFGDAMRNLTNRAYTMIEGRDGMSDVRGARRYLRRLIELAKLGHLGDPDITPDSDSEIAQLQESLEIRLGIDLHAVAIRTYIASRRRARTSMDGFIAPEYSLYGVEIPNAQQRKPGIFTYLFRPEATPAQAPAQTDSTLPLQGFLD